jgi:hypothetical protein
MMMKMEGDDVVGEDFGVDDDERMEDQAANGVEDGGVDVVEKGVDEIENEHV